MPMRQGFYNIEWIGNASVSLSLTDKKISASGNFLKQGQKHWGFKEDMSILERRKRFFGLLKCVLYVIISLMLQKSRDHLHSVNESYVQHMAFATGFGFRLIGAGLAAIAHGLCPAIFQYTGSKTVKALYEKLMKRVPPPHG